jgi:hypothetical protein
MTKTFNRRVILRGLGGAAVAAPFLSSVAEREAKAQSAPATAPKRLIVWFTHYGCLTDRWFPAKSHGPLTSAEYMALPTLAPMAPYAAKLLMPRGIRAMNEWSFQGTLGQKNDPHTQVCGSYFTCYPVTPNAPSSGIDNIGKFDAKPTGRSLDHIAAEQVNKNGAAPLFMQIGGVTGSNSNTQSVISWSDSSGTIFPGVSSATQIFNNLTNLFGTGTPTNGDTYRMARGKSVIDCVREDLGRLMSVPMSGSDKRKLTDWTELLHYTGGAVVSSAQCTMDTATTKLGLTSTALSGAMGGLGGDISKIAPVMMDLAVLTAICDSNRVIFMKMPPSYTFRNLGLTLESHSVSHRIGNAGMGGACVTNAIDMIHTIDKFYATQFAYLVGRLDGFAEGDGKTVLDNSATVWLQEMSDGNSHNLNNMPILQAGSCGGYFKTGQAINVEGAVANMTAGNSTKDCVNGQSTNLDGVGTPAATATMPINKYFCNLLNAIGVKAGADGFPVKGGTAPVTKFGKYDDSKLFADGGTMPATFKSPGEYTELKA